MHKIRLSLEFEYQKNVGSFDINKLALALIEEASGSEEISEDSFRVLLQLFRNADVLKSDDFHSLTTAIWTEPETLSKEQLVKLGKELKSIDFSQISKGNAYSLCDMIGYAFAQADATEILDALVTQLSL